ncbi:MAG: ATP synthase F1 subunit epsilon [Chloroflexi bacterium]|nr:ATP synthase F1 subunit epsilon [Chloroflexota bacterium]
MPGLSLDIVTAEREVFPLEDVDAVTLPAAGGELTILPHHASLLTLLQAGVMRVTRRGGVVELAITGGFAEIHGSKLRVLADAAERSEEIDLARAQAAEARAKALLADPSQIREGPAAAEMLRRSQVRLKVARRRRADGSSG